MAEIKIRELSIGDWVEIQGVAKRIDYLYGKDNVCDVPIELVHPIPLTPEILEKNGFVRGEYSEIRVYNEWEIGEWSDPPYASVRLDIDRQVIRVTNRGRDMFIADKEVYVHQLQHALRLAGVEKEIEV
jgi:hypothetical protein